MEEEANVFFSKRSDLKPLLILNLSCSDGTCCIALVHCCTLFNWTKAVTPQRLLDSCVGLYFFLLFVFLLKHVVEELIFQSYGLNFGMHIWSKRLQTSTLWSASALQPWFSCPLPCCSAQAHLLLLISTDIWLHTMCCFFTFLPNLQLPSKSFLPPPFTSHTNYSWPAHHLSLHWFLIPLPCHHSKTIV